MRKTFGTKLRVNFGDKYQLDRLAEVPYKKILILFTDPLWQQKSGLILN